MQPALFAHRVSIGCKQKVQQIITKFEFVGWIGIQRLGSAGITSTALPKLATQPQGGSWTLDLKGWFGRFIWGVSLRMPLSSAKI